MISGLIEQKMIEIGQRIPNYLHKMQKEHLPQYMDLCLTKVFEYEYLGYFHKQRKEKVHMFMSVNIPYMYNNEAEETYIDSMSNLVKNHKVFPFILFINGRMVPWGYMTIVKDTNKSYIICDYSEEASQFSEYKTSSCIYLPFTNIRYQENIYSNGSLTANCVELFTNLNITPLSFYFDGNRKFTTSSSGCSARLDIYSRAIVSDVSVFSVAETGGVKRNRFDYSSLIPKAAYMDPKINLLMFRDGEILSYRNIDTRKYLTPVNTYDELLIMYPLDNTEKYTPAEGDCVVINTDKYVCTSDDGIYSWVLNPDLDDVDERDNIKYMTNGIFCTKDGEDNLLGTVVCVMSYYAAANDTVNHTAHLDKDCLRTRINNRMNGITDSYSEIDSKIIDNYFNFDVSGDNIYRKGIDHTLNYDSALFNSILKETSTVIQETYTGEELRLRGLSTGERITFSRKRGDKFLSYFMMFINGKLYKHHSDIKYEGNTAYIPTNSIQDSDTVEFIIFTDVCNDIGDIVVPEYNTSAEQDSSIFIDERYDMDKVELCTIDHSGMIRIYEETEMMTDGRVQFSVPFKYDHIGDTLYRVRLENSNYYNKRIQIVPSRQFRHVSYSNAPDQYKFLLPFNFRYCRDKKKYMVFINQKKIDAENFLVTATSETRPFNAPYIYITTFLEDTDTLDVFYLPDVVEDVISGGEISTDGYLHIHKTKQYLSKELCMVFVNGVKITKDKLVDISRDRIRICNKDGSIDTIKNVSVVKYIPDIDELTVDMDEWTSIVDDLYSINGDTSLNTFLGGSKYVITKSGDKWPDFKTEEHNSLRSIIYDIIVEYYVGKTSIQTNDVFVYDLEREVFSVNSVFGKASKYDGLTWQEDVVSASELTKKYPLAADGWAVNVTGEKEVYIYSDGQWNPILVSIISLIGGIPKEYTTDINDKMVEYNIITE